MAPRRQKRQDDTSTRPQQAAHAPVAEAIAIGAAAGGLVLGTMQAQGAMPDGQDVAPSPAPDTAQRHDGETLAAQAADTEAPAPESAPIAPQPLVHQADPAQTPPPVSAYSLPQGATDVAVANSIPAPMQTQLVSELSEQMTATLVKVIGNAEPGLSADDLGQSIAGDIMASAQQIVANLDIGSLLAETQSLPDGILAQIDPPGIIANVLDATSGIADGVLGEVADIPSSILGDTDLLDLPSSLLGNDGLEGSGGLLSEIFYADGASDSLEIPLLGEVASTFMTGGDGGGLGLLGLSYIDVTDHQSGNGLNALSLL
ncbi:hypothetical protein SAMN05428969_0998 [Devosia sp. YR412]|uniref:hypothetical protein n=1 Tax=Devosia sp. YR412 TaxID=1881030 RepID=UPI0008CE8987|nr:hypothetical protein [Devosia sp. YR412]SEP80676.1 hypothetical protein SAMN05428969_0998 [Devosia sp. YR412]